MAEDRLAWYRDQMERAEDGRTLAHLMSMLERVFEIPASKGPHFEEFKRKNPDIVALYFEMARRRWKLG